MEQARIGRFDALVPRGEAWKSTGIVIANAACNFKRPINYPGTVEVRLLVGPPGGTIIDMEKQKPVRIPPNIREALQ